jgi:hypothetical protein
VTYVCGPRRRNKRLQQGVRRGALPLPLAALQLPGFSRAMVMMRDGKSRGMGLVEFETIDQASAAMQAGFLGALAAAAPAQQCAASTCCEGAPPPRAVGRPPNLLSRPTCRP